MKKIIGLFLVLYLFVLADSPAKAQLSALPGDSLVVEIPFSGDPVYFVDLEYSLTGGLQFLKGELKGGSLGTASKSRAILLKSGQPNTITAFSAGSLLVHVQVAEGATGEQQINIHQITGYSPGKGTLPMQGAGQISIDVASVEQHESRVQAAVPSHLNHTATTLGLRFQDQKPLPGSEGLMFTPVDLTVPGEQHFPIIASNAFHVGTALLQVQEGKITVSCVFPKGVAVRSAFLTFFPDLEAVSSVDPQALAGQALPFDVPISIENNLAGDNRVLLYAHFLMDYDPGLPGLHRFDPDSPETLALLKAMKALME